MRHVVLATLVVLIGGGCAAVPAEPGATVPLDEVLSGAALFEAPVVPAPDASGTILALDAEMRDFVRRQIGEARNAGARLRGLVKGMREAGLLDLGYDSEATLTAAEVFHTRRGNCLAATNLFVALARHAGLNVEFHGVEVPPVWVADAGYVVLDQHVNAVVKDVWRNGPRRSSDYVMDFNQPEAQSAFEHEPVADPYAFALFYNNLAVDYLRADNLREAVAHLARAIELEPRSVAAWVNLGALHSKQQRYDHAIAAYREAIRLDPANKPALSNLASLHAYLGNEALAARYRRAVAYYQDHNPYFQFAIARDAYQRGTYTNALQAIDRAIKLKGDDHSFYFLRGAVLVQLGEYRRARESLTKAHEYAPYHDTKQRYAAKLDALTTLRARGARRPGNED